MKKNINVIALFLVSAILVSCGDDDYSIAYQDTETKTPLSGTLMLERNAAAPSTVLGFSYTLPQSFEVDAVVQVSGTSSFSSLGADPFVTRSFDTLRAGETTGTGTIRVPGRLSDMGGFYGIAEYSSYQLTGVALVQTIEVEGEIVDNPVADPFVLTSDPVTISSLDYQDVWMDQTLVTGAMAFLLDWSDEGASDLDMAVYDTDGTQWENSGSGSRYEGDFFNASHPDGEYYVQVDVFGLAPDTVDLEYNMHFTKPDGRIDYYVGTFTAAELASGVIAPVINISKSTDADGNVTFTTSSPE